MLNSKLVGNKIAAARKQKNLSQAELAQQVLISQQAVGKWERGESMPDLTMLNRIADILGVDLNYFSENLPTIDTKHTSVEKTEKPVTEPATEKRAGWDLSAQNLVDCDFSGLHNLHEKLNASNMQRCQFIGAQMSGLLLKSNNVADCNFSDSDMSKSRIQSSMFSKNCFANCSFKSTKFSRSFVDACDFTGANLSDTEFYGGGFSKNLVSGAVFYTTAFIDMAIEAVVFEGLIEDCRFENCSFYGVTFQNATISNTLFRNNKKIKQLQFVNCKTDKLTFAFLKNNGADVNGLLVEG